MIFPLAPADPLFIVLNNIQPLLVAVPIPLYNNTDPPLPVAPVPDDNNNEPPIPAEP